MDKRITVSIEALLRNGREMYLTLELPRDEIIEQDGSDVVTYRINPEPGVVEEHVIHTSEVAYMKRRETIEPLQSPLRTLGREPAAQSR